MCHLIMSQTHINLPFDFDFFLIKSKPDVGDDVEPGSAPPFMTDSRLLIASFIACEGEGRKW